MSICQRYCGDVQIRLGQAPCRHKSRGFTLLEVMVAMVLMALFATAGYRALDAVLNAEHHAGQELDRWHRLATAFARISGDISNLVPNVHASPGTPSGLQLGVDSNQQFLVAWDRLLPRDQPGGLKRVGYTFRAGVLYRLTWRQGAPVDEAPQEFPILNGLAKVELRALDEHAAWQTHWPVVGISTQPRALEWRFELTDGTQIRRLWLVS